MKIELRNYCKTIRSAEVLRNVTCTFESGVCYGLYGVNGSGKTMLMRAVAGLIRPTSGDILTDGRPGSALGRVGLLLENPSFLDSMTGLENLLLLAKIQNRVGEKEAREAISLLGLDPDDKRKYRKYSLGMKQRLGIAAAVMEDPPVVLLDEPFNALDRAGAATVEALIRSLKERKKLILLACHERGVLDELSDELFLVENGKVTLYDAK